MALNENERKSVVKSAEESPSDTFDARPSENDRVRVGVGLMSHMLSMLLDLVILEEGRSSTAVADGHTVPSLLSLMTVPEQRGDSVGDGASEYDPDSEDDEESRVSGGSGRVDKVSDRWLKLSRVGVSLAYTGAGILRRKGIG